ncbi:hypothetical protein KI387_044485, partial [Taxus chinensis]
LPSLFLNLHLVPERNSGPVKVWKREQQRERRLEKCLQHLRACATSCKLPAPSLPPPHQPVPS